MSDAPQHSGPGGQSDAAPASGRAAVLARRARRKIAKNAPGRPNWKPGQPKFRTLVESPIFVLSSERSGSTLLRSVLGRHSQILAPHELHLSRIEVTAPTLSGAAMSDLGLVNRDLENILWDRVLHLRLTASGKHQIVDKTPANLHEWRRLRNIWPGARYIFLYRHPQRVYESWTRALPNADHEALAARVLDNMADMAAARSKLDGLEVRYERLTREPEVVATEICDYLGVPYEPEMLRYADENNSWTFERGLGDWSEKIQSGEITPERPVPDAEDVIPALREAVSLAGY